MKNSFLAFGIVLAVLFAGCTNLVTEGGGAGAAKDCASDFPCFVSSMQDDCAKAKVSVVENGVTAKLEVKGANADAGCDVLIKMRDIQKTEDMAPEIWGAIEKAKPGLALLDMTCPITAEKAQSLYQEKQILAAKEVFDKCTGSLKDVALLVVGTKVNAPAELKAELSVFLPEVTSGEKTLLVAKASGGKPPYAYYFDPESAGGWGYGADSQREHTYTNTQAVQKTVIAKVKVRDIEGTIVTAETSVKVNPAAQAGAQEPAQPAALASCTETDESSGEAKYRVRGTTTAVYANGSTETKTDECSNVDGRIINEYFCLNGAISNVTNYCGAYVRGSPHCLNGACVDSGVLAEPSCTESDGASGEAKYAVRGVTTAVYANGSTETKTDECVSADSRMIKEYFCLDGVINSHIPYCGAYITGSPRCSDGACVKNENKCVDSEPDGISNPDILGAVTVSYANGSQAQTFTDECMGAAAVKDYRCKGAAMEQVDINCGFRKICANGKCA